MALTTQQLATLKAAIAAETDPTFVAARNAGATGEMAAFYSADANPVFTVWKSMVSINLIGKAFDATELAALSSANQTRLQTLAMFLAGGVDPSQSSNRGFFDDIFSGAGGVNSRAKLLALWKRPARRIEKLFATGTGSDAVPAPLVYEGNLSNNDLVLALP